MSASGTAKGMSNEVLAGVVLAVAALLGLFFENIGALKPLYDQLLTTKATVDLGGAGISKPILLWINDGLMAIFFLFVALEIKKEILAGALSEWRRAALPVYGAIGGMAVPAAVFIGIVGIESAEARGWAIPAATDIAFALGILSMLGNRVPPSLKVFLLALAIVDDLAAIAIIAAFYTADLSLVALGLGAIGLALLAAMNVMGIRRHGPYIIVGLFLWVCVLKSGVHATLAGVALGFAIPMGRADDPASPMIIMKKALQPYVAFLVMPVFAFANAGVPLGDISFADLGAPLTLAIIAGLFIGKQIGVFGLAYAAIRMGLADRPAGASIAQIYGVALLAGIGFTMSLFIGTLAFEDVAHQNAVRLGVLCGSALSGITGVLVLLWAHRTSSVETSARQQVAEAA
ncbi:MAG: Na+/H+ antiporter NhaA [Pseudomonadota bacterium]